MYCSGMCVLCSDAAIDFCACKFFYRKFRSVEFEKRRLSLAVTVVIILRNFNLVFQPYLCVTVSMSMLRTCFCLCCLGCWCVYSKIFNNILSKISSSCYVTCYVFVSLYVSRASCVCVCYLFVRVLV